MGSLGTPGEDPGGEAGTCTTSECSSQSTWGGGGISPSLGQGNGAPEKPCVRHSPWKRISVTEPDGGGNRDAVRKRGL